MTYIKPTDKNKAWAKVILKKKPYKNNTIEKAKSFLIVCEGETEEYYFKSFPIVTATIKAVGIGMSNLELVEYAENLSNLDEYKDYEIWCVFDFDTNPNIENQKQDYNFAIEYAVKQGFKVAYSNDAFELWYVLHYKDIVSGELHRDVYFDFLGEKWDINYRKNGKTIEFAKKVYEKLENDTEASQAEAIKRAKRLFESQKDKPYSEQNPCTTIFELIEELNKYLKK